ncbi:ribosome biogenesis GTPase [Hydrogenivirga caldilitoris]|uniref:Small ribosomal subunit biogenesis GTPase RsgA n=1 Tax=Hydrogenivirga caldilitoris TaxID=246264 RepID=A0A497XPI2_9AQUI|nr:ribosome small subunit-dependent GTPase A [Hydrogenivirga caldilitoris]RLJ70896.1 ribosome biogenesis GTPase [Hydrogenivirga caldilitoris]
MEKGLVIERVAQLIGVYVPSVGKTFKGIPRGKLLKRTKIYAGDRVLGNIVDAETFAIEEVEERKNILIRPPIANVDRVICVMTIQKPEFDNYLLDSLLVVYDHVGCEPVVVFNKTDLLDEEGRGELERWSELYSKAGYEVVHVSAKTGKGIEEVVELVEGDICILAGPSGVGKSTILKYLTGEELRIGEISEKTQRGKHTTTGVKLIPFGKNSFIGDTPGFSRVEVLQFVSRKSVKNYFREFLRYECRYPDCLHVKEPGCGVKEAVKKGEISCERYKSYLKMLREYLEELSEICG